MSDDCPALSINLTPGIIDKAIEQRDSSEFVFFKHNQINEKTMFLNTDVASAAAVLRKSKNAGQLSILIEELELAHTLKLDCGTMNVVDLGTRNRNGSVSNLIAVYQLKPDNSMWNFRPGGRSRPPKCDLIILSATQEMECNHGVLGAAVGLGLIAVGGTAAISIRLAGVVLGAATWAITGKASRDIDKLQEREYAQAQLLLGLERSGIISQLRPGKGEVEFIGL